MMHEIEDGTVLLREKGVFTQAQLFEFRGSVFAAHGKGYVKLFKTGVCGTSKPSVGWVLESLTIPTVVSGAHRELKYKGDEK